MVLDRATTVPAVNQIEVHPTSRSERLRSSAPRTARLRPGVPWGLQHGRSVIPKSTKPERIAENLDVFDFELSTDQLAAIDGLDTNHRGGPEPEVVTLEAFGRDIPEA
jgi:diketogulonate reductase-like aldo/keto reductase